MRLPWILLALLISTSLSNAQPKIETPKYFPPDEATLKTILAKTEELGTALKAFDPERVYSYPDVAIYHKAAQWIVRHQEWYTKDSAKQTIAVLDAGLERARQLAAGKTPWVNVRGRAVARGFRSSIDGSYQPFVLTVPESLKDNKKSARYDTLLHGRDGTLTEVKMLFNAEKAKPVREGAAITIEPYGRGNNAYRWAGERDVSEAEMTIMSEIDMGLLPTASTKVIRGFSMGGAGAWHLGLRGSYDGVMPGAGFTTTHGYISGLPNPLPEYQEKCLRIYDAKLYAENTTNTCVVAYSGELDKQKAAADMIEKAIQGSSLTMRFKHIVAPGLEHKITPEWQAKVDEEFLRLRALPSPRSTRYITYDPNGLLGIRAQERPYQKSSLQYEIKDGLSEVITQNVRILVLYSRFDKIQIDGQLIPKSREKTPHEAFVKISGHWQPATEELIKTPMKANRISGPIDRAFMDRFGIEDTPVGNSTIASSIGASKARMVREWNKWMRGDLPVYTVKNSPYQHRVVFGDYTSPAVQEALKILPIVWNEQTLTVDGKNYDPRTHYPVMIYPESIKKGWRYLVLNSGHTFHEKEFQGTNAGLYPRLGDWAVLKVAPTKEDRRSGAV
jgi:hypothetical protein